MATFDPRAFEDETGIELERYPLGGFERKRRNGKTDYPYEGCFVWLTPDTPISLATGGLALQTSDGEGEGVDRGFRQICQGLSECVAGLDIPNAPAIWGNPDGVRSLSAELLMYIASIASSGEVPEDRPNASSRGRIGSGTKPPTGRATRTSESDPHPRENG